MRMRCISKGRAPYRGIVIASVLAFIYTLLLFLSGCGMLRKVEKESNESFATESVMVRSDNLVMNLDHAASISLQEAADSSYAGYVMEIWPKGKFSISKDGVFEGEALKINMRGQHTTLSKSSSLVQQEEVKSALNSVNKQSIRQEELGQQQVLVKKNPAWKWALTILAVAIGFSFYFNRQLEF